MWPTLFTIGHFSLQTSSLFSVIAFVLSGFIFWRKSREEHYSESQAFDGFLLSVIFGFIIGRLGYIGLHWSSFGWDFFRWSNFVAFPGTQFVIGMIASGWYLARFAGQKKWDTYEVLDFWVIASALGAAIRYLGSFFEGSMYGLPTNMPWGFIFTQTQEKVHPTQLYLSVMMFVLFYYLSQVEYQYRTFEWYRYGKKTAQTGFLLASFILFYSLMGVVTSFVRLPEFVVSGVALDLWLYLIGSIVGGSMLWVRSGRQLLWWK